MGFGSCLLQVPQINNLFTSFTDNPSLIIFPFFKWWVEGKRSVISFSGELILIGFFWTSIFYCFTPVFVCDTAERYIVREDTLLLNSLSGELTGHFIPSVFQFLPAWFHATHTSITCKYFKTGLSFQAQYLHSLLLLLLLQDDMQSLPHGMNPCDIFCFIQTCNAVPLPS